MILDKIFGYWVTDYPATLIAFLAEARQCYDELEQSLAPLAGQVEALHQDRQPRSTEFWQQTLVHVAAIRSAAAQVLTLFSKEATSQENPAPIIVAATAIAYRSCMHSIHESIEEAGICLTAYMLVSASVKEEDLRQCQRVVHGLEEVLQVGRRGIAEGRAKLDEALGQQQQLFIRKGSNSLQPRREETPHLRLVSFPQQQTEEEGQA